jgi:hypothetical protein
VCVCVCMCISARVNLVSVGGKKLPQQDGGATVAKDRSRRVRRSDTPRRLASLKDTARSLALLKVVSGCALC